MQFEVIARGPDGQLVLVVRTRDDMGLPPVVLVGGSPTRSHDHVRISDGDEIVVGDEVLGLPESVRAQIQEQFRRVASRAARHFPSTRGDEDTVTGGLIHDIQDNVQGSADGYEWKTISRKLRGRGDGAPEKRYGADLDVEIEVIDQGVRRRKTLLVQAKKEWDTKDAKLGEQAGKLAELPGDGAVFDFREGEYRGCRASVAAKAEGNRRHIPDSEFENIGDLLADFVACRLGSTRVFYDPDEERLVVVEDNEVLRIVDLKVEYLTRTTVRRQRPATHKEHPAKRKRRKKRKRKSK